MYGLYASGKNNDKTIVTADGGGDGSNGTIWINKKNVFKQFTKQTYVILEECIDTQLYLWVLNLPNTNTRSWV